MKNIYSLVFAFLMLFLAPLELFPQSIEINGPGEVEVGKPYTYTFKFKLGDSPPENAASYRIETWEVVVDHILGSDIPGFIDGINNNPVYFNPNTPGDLSIPIQWGDATEITSDKIRVYASGVYLNSNGNIVDNFNSVTKTKDIVIKRVCSPLIESGEVFDCSTGLVEISANNYCNADSFQWSLSEGTIKSGQGTSAIMVEPPLRGNFNAQVKASRSSGVSAYTRQNSKAIVRAGRSAQFELIYDSYDRPTYICKGDGQLFAIQDNDDIDNIVWNANNASISAETISGGKRIVNIMPNSSASLGSSITVSAVVNYIGGCSTNTQSETFTVYESETPPSPQGSVFMTPISGDVCDPEGYEVHFQPSNPYDNGKVTVSPLILPPHAGTSPRPITVCYRNLCSGKQTCETIMAYPPLPCNTALDKGMVIFPNPSSGKINISLVDQYSGDYVIYNNSGIEVQRGKVKGQKDFDITLAPHLRSGNYFLKIRNKNGAETTAQIIINR